MSERRGGVCAKHGPYPTQKRCPVCNKEHLAAWASANREQCNTRMKARRGVDLDAHRTRERQHAQALKAQTIHQYGGRCACCEETALVFLTIDHPEGNGAAHRRELFGRRDRGGEPFYQWLRRNGWPLGYRVLCWNCQHATTRGVCPHQQV